MNTEIKEQIKDMLIENLRIPEAELDYDTELFGGGIGLDSIDALEIISGVDEMFGVNMSGADREYFRSIDKITEFVVENMED